MADLFVSERMVGCSVLDLARRPDKALDRIVAAGKGCLQDGADILVLGCLGMGFQRGLVARLTENVGAPVINPVVAALKTAEAALALGLTSTRPERKTDDSVVSLEGR
ncbi:hypothetical protein FF100_31425 [Methylobacterium terricola]|uniref:Asp/Glu/Hydantoin racemase n=1 Tax=Methylobacterium terricola TaxID=2583531 RepID=A0A5C4L7Y7_9HYPH|nr:hypothetical protein FF100_31425 [Methylobacterium terricola]